MTDSNYEAMKGTYVRFCIEDLHWPDRAEVLDQLHRRDELRGRVIAITDGGAQGVFVMIEVAGLEQRFIVPAEKVEPAE